MENNNFLFSHIIKKKIKLFLKKNNDPLLHKNCDTMLIIDVDM